ncbi:dynamin family protein [Burkholderia sp. S171]|uniref:dynamin family protein n=1 Tax=Burkholderia sp. S171 TaxID=1641860 RepID=UPI00131B38C1|nr:dynamin family protein [Burkholderia sp. S171]
MTAGYVLGLRARLDTLVRKNHDLLGDEHESLVRKHGVDRVEDLASAFTKIDDDERLLQVGVVGRVKAGKSSLINALLFGGETVLPKAATPMTAALTRLSWGESLSGEVEFYSSADIDNIRANAELYAGMHETLTSEQFKTLRKRRDADLASTESDEALMQRASRFAERQLSERPTLSAANDQFARISRAGMSLRGLGATQTLQARDLTDLRNQLQDYVSADGRFMPFTKSVHIRLPLENLRDIAIVDTPGLNDPVASREERTCELLKYCDVIFIVSPAGQFLNAEDLDLMGRVTHKEGVRELYLLASQVDTQLFGSNYAGGRLDAALKTISDELGTQMRETLRAFRDAHPEVGTTFDKLIASGAAKLLHSSGLSHSLSTRFERRDDWDDGAAKVWENLSAYFPDYFPAGNVPIATSNLDKLSNIGALHAVIADVRGQKEVIKAERRDALAAAKGEALAHYRNDLLNYIKERNRRIGDGDIGKLNEQCTKLEKRRVRLTDVLVVAFRVELHGFTSELDRQLSGKIRETFNALKRTLEDEQGTYNGSYRTENDGAISYLARKLSLGGYTNQTYSETTVMTPNVSNGLIAISDRIQASVDRIVKEHLFQWEEALRKTLFRVLRENVPEEEIDGYLERRTIHDLVDNLKRPSLQPNLELPANLTAQGKLQGSAADDYINAAKNYIGDLERRFESGIKRYIDQTDELKHTDVAGLFLSGYSKQVEALENEIRNKKLVTERLAQLAIDLDKVTQ